VTVRAVEERVAIRWARIERERRQKMPVILSAEKESKRLTEVEATSNISLSSPVPRLRCFPNVMDHDYFVYILTNKGRSTLYIGVTNDLPTRLWQHRNPERTSFSQRYHRVLLMHAEHFPDVNAAIAREKQLKGWRRAKKIALIEKDNPRWDDCRQIGDSGT
jgi:putative endonuclease